MLKAELKSTNRIQRGSNDVLQVGLKSFSSVILDFFGMGMMVERLKHKGTSRSSSDLLKIFRPERMWDVFSNLQYNSFKSSASC